MTDASSAVRTAAQFQAAVGVQAQLDSAPTSFRTVALSRERITPVRVQRRPQLFSEYGAPSMIRTLRTHLEGEIEAPATSDALTCFLPLLAGGTWQRDLQVLAQYTAPDLRRYSQHRWLMPGVNATPFSLARRYAASDRWQIFGGMKARELLLGLDSLGEAMMRVRMVGRGAGPQRRLSPSPSVMAPPLGLRGHGAVTIRSNDGTVFHSAARDGAILVAGLTVHLRRQAMRPLFAMQADTPFDIIDTGLHVSVAMTLLANDAALRLEAALAAPFAMRLLLHDKARRLVLIDLPRMRRTDWFQQAPSPGAAVTVELAAEAVRGDDDSVPQVRFGMFNLTGGAQ